MCFATPEESAGSWHHQGATSGEVQDREGAEAKLLLCWQAYLCAHLARRRPAASVQRTRTNSTFPVLPIPNSGSERQYSTSRCGDEVGHPGPHFLVLRHTVFKACCRVQTQTWACKNSKCNCKRLGRWKSGLAKWCYIHVQTGSRQPNKVQYQRTVHDDYFNI